MNTKDFDYYKKRLEIKDIEAYYELGKTYYLGNVVPKNYQKAYLYLKKAAILDHKKAKYNLGIIYLNKKTKYY